MALQANADVVVAATRSDGDVAASPPREQHAMVTCPTACDEAGDGSAEARTTSVAFRATAAVTAERGVCPVKAEYRCAAPPRVSLDSEGRTRGMNRGAERARSAVVAGTQRPTLEGEGNMLDGDTLQRIKSIVRGKGRRQDEQQRPLQTSHAAATLARHNDDNNDDVDGHGGGGHKPAAAPSSTVCVACSSGSSSSGSGSGGGTGCSHAYDVVCATECGVKRDRDVAERDDTTSVCTTSPPPPPPPLPTATAAAATTTTMAARTTRETETETETDGTAAGGERGGGGGGCVTAATGDSREGVREQLSRQRERARTLFADKLILAPLTTVGNLPFRRICKGFGADVTMSEMALVPSLLRMEKREWALLRRHSSEDVFGIQVAVGRPHDASLFARALAVSGFDYDFVDINCGCPVDAIMRSGCGCGLAERKGRLRGVVQQLATHQLKPVTIKCRIGADEEHPTLHHCLDEYAEWGASAVSVHGRSRRQRYTRLADWDYIEQCARSAPVPIIGNGDIMSYEDIVHHRSEHTGVSAYMIGRGALIKPWVFDEIKSGQVRDIHSNERLDMLRTFCSHGLAHWGADERGVMTTRRYLCEWLSFLHRYVPAGLLECLPQKINERPPCYRGRNELETLLASDSVADWVHISEMLLGPAEKGFRFTPKHKSNSYTTDTICTETLQP